MEWKIAGLDGATVTFVDGNNNEIIDKDEEIIVVNDRHPSRIALKSALKRLAIIETNLVGKPLRPLQYYVDSIASSIKSMRHGHFMSMALELGYAEDRAREAGITFDEEFVARPQILEGLQLCQKHSLREAQQAKEKKQTEREFRYKNQAKKCFEWERRLEKYMKSVQPKPEQSPTREQDDTPTNKLT